MDFICKHTCLAVAESREVAMGDETTRATKGGIDVLIFAIDRADHLKLQEIPKETIGNIQE